jgi:hypothetical protein
MRRSDGKHLRLIQIRSGAGRGREEPDANSAAQERSSNRRRFICLEEPGDAVFVDKMSISSERHVSQIDEEFLVSSYGQLVEYGLELRKCCAIDIQTDGVALLRPLCGVQPIGGRELNSSILQASMNDLAMLLARDLVFHGSVAEPGETQIAAQAALIERHSFSAVAVKQQEGGQVDHKFVSRALSVG